MAMITAIRERHRRNMAMAYVHFDSQRGCDRLVQDICEEKMCVGFTWLRLYSVLITDRGSIFEWIPIADVAE